MKVLNLYSGIGGNRKLWNDIDVTAVEINPDIANIYKDFFPNDNVIVADAHQYLLEHFKEFDFIWSSPSCKTHSDIRRAAVQGGLYDDFVYPDMTLYQEIIFLKHFSKCPYVVENVKPYYKTFVSPTFEFARHLFWSNFYVQKYNLLDDRLHNDIKGSSVVYGFDLNSYELKNKRELLRNLVNPLIGQYIMESLNIQLTNKELRLAI